jgi:hypothetical protein
MAKTTKIKVTPPLTCPSGTIPVIRSGDKASKGIWKHNVYYCKKKPEEKRKSVIQTKMEQYTPK